MKEYEETSMERKNVCVFYNLLFSMSDEGRHDEGKSRDVWGLLL